MYCQAINNKKKPCKYHLTKGSTDKFCYFHKIRVIHKQNMIDRQLIDKQFNDNRAEIQIPISINGIDKKNEKDEIIIDLVKILNRFSNLL